MATRDSRFGVALYGAYREIKDDFAGVHAPKLKFNFTMSITFSDMFSSYPGNDDPYKIEFAIKQITRPAPNFIYEDVNYYNFMTKVATRIDFGVVTVTLYDDRTNKAHDLFKKYMESVSPITNVDRSGAPRLHREGQSRSALLGPLTNGAANGPIKNIRVNHITDHKGSKVIYDFLNPKIQNVVLDELDMTQSDVNTITFTFIYDSYNVTSESDGETNQEMEETVTTAIRPQAQSFLTSGLENEGTNDVIIDGIKVYEEGDPTFIPAKPVIPKPGE